jgi:hypothetical protein
MHLRARAMVLCVILLLATFAPSATANNDGAGDADSWAVSLEERIDRGLRFRESVGLRSDREYVVSLYRDDQLQAVENEFGVVLTPTEYAEMKVRLAMEDDVQLIEQQFGTNSQLAAAFGGVMIDHKGGGKLVVLLTKDAIGPGDDWLRGLRHPARAEIRTVTHSLAYLESLQQQVRDALVADDPVLSAWVETTLDVENNVVVLAIDEDQAEPSVEHRILDGSARRG